MATKNQLKYWESLKKIKLSKNHKIKISNALKGRMPKNIKIIAGWNKGKKLPNFSGKNHPRWKGKVKINCEICKQRFEAYPYQKNNTKYCSMNCRNKALAINNRGDKTNLWKGGVSYEPYTIDWTKTLRKSIRERDHYFCQLCREEQEDRMFDIHHIDYDKKNCNPDNLITLCQKCHKKTNHKREYYINHFKEIT